MVEMEVGGGGGYNNLGIKMPNMLNNIQNQRSGIFDERRPLSKKYNYNKNI